MKKILTIALLTGLSAQLSAGILSDHLKTYNKTIAGSSLCSTKNVGTVFRILYYNTSGYINGREYEAKDINNEDFLLGLDRKSPYFSVGIRDFTATDTDHPLVGTFTLDLKQHQTGKALTGTSPEFDFSGCKTVDELEKKINEKAAILAALGCKWLN